MKNKMKRNILILVLLFPLWGQGGFCLAQTASYFGRYAGGVGVNQNSLQRASAIGYNAKVAVDDGLVLGDSTLVKVGIGTANPQARLDVRGAFRLKGNINFVASVNQNLMNINNENFLAIDSEGVPVLSRFKIKYDNQNQWSDKVFDKKYKLLKINQLEKFIEANNHLPNVPSASEVVKDGVAMDAMVSKLLEKVEELTLYMIQQQKEIEVLKKKVNTKNQIQNSSNKVPAKKDGYSQKYPQSAGEG
jgi:trimeric autotransporter adhesin